MVFRFGDLLTLSYIVKMFWCVTFVMNSNEISEETSTITKPVL